MKWLSNSVNLIKLTTTVVLPQKRAFNQTGSAPRKVKTLKIKEIDREKEREIERERERGREREISER